MRTGLFMYVYFVLFGSYYLFYQGLIDASPTLTIVRNINNAGKSGMSDTEIHRLFTDENLVVYRLSYLIEKQLIREKENRYTITLKGIRFLNKVLLARKILQLKDALG